MERICHKTTVQMPGICYKTGVGFFSEKHWAKCFLCGSPRHLCGSPRYINFVTRSCAEKTRSCAEALSSTNPYCTRICSVSLFLRNIHQKVSYILFLQYPHRNCRASLRIRQRVMMICQIVPAMPVPTGVRWSGLRLYGCFLPYHTVF